MVKDFPIISANTGKEEYLWKYSFFSKKTFPGEKSVPFDLPPEQPDFPYKRKKPLVCGGLNDLVYLFCSN